MATCTVQLGQGRLGSFQTVRKLGDDDLRARRGQGSRGGLADPGARSGDERGHAGETVAGSWQWLDTYFHADKDTACGEGDG
jgi:hypothetical protein